MIKLEIKEVFKLFIYWIPILIIWATGVGVYQMIKEIKLINKIKGLRK